MLEKLLKKKLKESYIILLKYNIIEAPPGFKKNKRAFGFLLLYKKQTYKLKKQGQIG